MICPFQAHFGPSVITPDDHLYVCAAPVWLIASLASRSLSFCFFLFIRSTQFSDMLSSVKCQTDFIAWSSWPDPKNSFLTTSNLEGSGKMVSTVARRTHVCSALRSQRSCRIRSLCRNDRAFYKLQKKE